MSKSATIKRTIRKMHRLLGLVFGIQFLLWTLGGMYFSWSNINEVRGDDIRQNEPPLFTDSCNAPLSSVIGRIKMDDKVVDVKSVQLVTVLDKTYYQVTYTDGINVKCRLANTATGELRLPLTEKEAVAVALSRLKTKAVVNKVDYIIEAGPHHEYREKPLPAYAVNFGAGINTTVYVGAETGIVQSFRNNNWRTFDFLWMLHTMDYTGRDNINNWVLRIFSAAGLFAVLSGFVLYAVTVKRKFNKNKKPEL